MKRCIKWLLDWFADWIRQFDWEQIVGFAISGLVGIALTIMMFVYTDKVPATPSDYEQLEDQVNVIQQNPDLLLETSKEDKSIFWLWALLLGLIVGGFEIYFVGCLLSFVIILLKIKVVGFFKEC